MLRSATRGQQLESPDNKATGSLKQPLELLREAPKSAFEVKITHLFADFGFASRFKSFKSFKSFLSLISPYPSVFTVLLSVPPLAVRLLAVNRRFSSETPVWNHTGDADDDAFRISS